MIINVHAGHCPDGKGACGAVGILKESTENRKVKNEVIRYLKLAGHTVYDCTCDTEETKSDCLKKIVAKCNAHNADFNLSIHFNDGVKDPNGNGRQTGTEVWATSYSGIKGKFGERYLEGMRRLGFKEHGDGKKTTSGLYVLNHTKAPAALVEVCFVHDKDDVDLYKKVGYTAVAKVIAEAIHGSEIKETTVKATIHCPILSKGSKGAAVVRAQRLLIADGYSCGSAKDDGDYGSSTYNAVVKYQHDHKLTENGIINDAVWASLLHW